MKVPSAKRKAFKLSAKGSSKAPSEPSSVGIFRPLPDTEFRKDPPLSEAQKKQIEELEEYVNSELALPESDAYAHWERVWLDKPNCLARYLAASDWKMKEAKERIEGTLKWRREYKPDLIKPSEIREETEGGKIVVSGFSKQGLPVMYLRPARETTDPSPTQIKHLIFQLERAIDVLPEGVSKLFLLIDYKGAGAKSNPSIATAKQVIDILQNHYVERLGKAVVVNCPWYLKSLFSTITPFLDAATKDKLQMNPDLTKLIPAEQLDAEFKGGDYHFTYDWQVYLPSICTFCGIKDDGTREEKHRPPMKQSMTAASRALSDGRDDDAATQADETATEADENLDDDATMVNTNASEADQDPKLKKRHSLLASQANQLTPAQAESIKKKKRRNPGLFACFRAHGMDDDDIHVYDHKAGASQAEGNSAVAHSHSHPASNDLNDVSHEPQSTLATTDAKFVQIDPEQAAIKRAKIEAESSGESPAIEEEEAKKAASEDPTESAAPPAPQTVTQALTQSVYDEVAGLQAAAGGLVSNIWPGAAASSADGQANTTSTDEQQAGWLSTLNPANLLGGSSPEKPQEVKSQA